MISPSFSSLWFLCVLTWLCSPHAEAGFALNGNQFAEGEEITASFSESPGNSTDWVGIYSDPGNGPVDGVFVGGSTIWRYTSGTQTAGAGVVDGSVTFASPGLAPGNYIAFFMANDGYESIEDPVPFAVRVAGEVAPEFLVDPVSLVRAEVGGAYGGRLGAYVSDPGDELTFAKVSGAEWLMVGESGDLSGVPAETDLGENVFIISVTDSAGLSDQAVVTIAVTPVGGAPVESVGVMTYNLWVGGTTSKNLAAIIKSGADVLGLQETNGQAARHAESLGWHALQSGGSTAVLSKYPIIETYTAGAGVGARIRISTDPFQEIVVWSCHLTAFPYGPYDGCFDGASEASILGNETVSGRLPQVQTILTAMEGQLGNADQVPVFLVGDFNTPSHLDWTEATAASHCDYAINWPVTLAVAAADLTDAYRVVHPDPAVRPGNTWSPIVSLRDNTGLTPEPQDRIDMIHYKGADVEVQSAEVYVLPGPLEDMPNHGGNAWGSDHASVVATFMLPEPDGSGIPSLFSPVPSDNANELANTGLDLSWSGGAGADLFKVYLGRTDSLGEDDLVAELDVSTFQLGELEKGVRYFWRVDVVKGEQVLEGGGWSFATDTGVSQVAQWEFDEGSGESVGDSLGSGISGVFVDVDSNEAWTETSILGKGVALNPFDGWIAFGDDPRLRPTTGLTVSAWVNPLSFEEWGGIASFIHDTGATEAGYSLHTRSNGRFGWGVASGDSGVIQYLTSPTGYAPDSWYQVVGTYDGSEITLYVNGQEVSRQAHTGPIDWEPLPVEGFIVGSYLDDNEDLRYDGQITQIGVWRKALTTEEIRNLFIETGSAICPSSLTCTEDSANGTVTLTWTPGRNVSGSALEVLRDGVVLTELALDADSFSDSPPNANDPGTVEVRYTVRIKGGDPNECPPLTCTASFFNGQITDDLVLYLGFDGDFVDRSPSSITGTVSGAPLSVDGRVGQSFQFDDMAEPRQYVSMGDSEALRFGAETDFSVSLWVKSTSAFTDNRESGGTNYDPAIISNKDWNSGVNPGWVIAGNSSNQGNGIGNLEWNIGDGSARADFDQTNLQINDGDWHHILVSHDRDENAVFYVDGNQVGEVDISGIGDIDSDLPTNVGTDGAEGATWENWFPGALDDVAIWRRVVSAEEVATIFQNGQQGVGLPSAGDLDGDGLPDDWETANFGGIVEFNGVGDPDDDGLSNIGEWREKTDPNAEDSDSDGASDGREVAFGTEPLSAESVPPANGVVSTVSNSRLQDWSNEAVWSDSLAPGAGKAYFVNGRAPLLRTPLETNPVFGGASLMLLEGSQLRLQHSGTANVPELVLNGGELVFDGVEGGNVGLGGGTLSVTNESRIAPGNSGTISIQSQITGEGVLVIAAQGEGATVAVNYRGNTFTGTWNIESGRLVAQDARALEGSNITMGGGGLDPGGNLNSPEATLTLASAESTVVFRHQMAFKSVKIVPEGGTEIALDNGEYDSAALSDMGLGFIFGEGDGLLIVGGVLTEPETSPFQILAVDDLGNGKLSVTWMSEPGVVYGIQMTPDLQAPWQELGMEEGADGIETGFELERSEGLGFVRIVRNQ